MIGMQEFLVLQFTVLTKYMARPLERYLLVGTRPGISRQRWANGLKIEKIDRISRFQQGRFQSCPDILSVIYDTVSDSSLGSREWKVFWNVSDVMNAQKSQLFPLLI